MNCSIWRITPAHTPRVRRRCARCDRAREFASSDRFRVNAHRRRLDVWLIYRCVGCDQPWNMTLFERVTPEQLGGELLHRLHLNEPQTAWSFAFDAQRLARLKADADFATEFRVDGIASEIVRFELAYPCRVRLDRVVAKGLGVSRSKVRSLVLSAGQPSKLLRRKIADGDTIKLQL